MKRRDFIAVVGGAAASSLPAQAQQPSMPVIGWLSSGLQATDENFRLPGFRLGLEETGFTEGRNVAIEYRRAEDRIERLPALAADLVNRRVSLIMAAASPAAAMAAKSATTSIPIVFVTSADPVHLGLVASLNRPGGNVTGVTTVSAELEGKRLGLLRELVPSATSIGVLVNPTRLGVDTQLAQTREAASALGLTLHVLEASSEADLDAAFSTLTRLRADALVITADGLFADHRDSIIALSKQHSVPTTFQFREFAASGGLMTYGPRSADSYREAGILAGRIFKGEKAADLPVKQPTRFELVINMRTAKELGIAVPISMQLLADEVIE